MVKVRRKGKIAKSEWQTIVSRHKAGEALASIARDYGCTAPAIRYIVSRTPADPEFPDGAAGPVAPLASADRVAPAQKGFAAQTGDRRDAGRELDDLRSVLQDRVTSDLALFLVAVDGAIVDASRASLSRLREATDRVMRCAARILIELERAENAAELPPRRPTANGVFGGGPAPVMRALRR